MVGHPEQMRHVRQIALQAPQHRMAFEESADRIGRGDFHRGKVLRQSAEFLGLLRQSEQKIFVLVIKPGESANDVAGVRAHAKLGQPANVDGDLH